MGWLKEKTISIFHFHLLWFGKSLKYCSKTRDFFRNKLLNRYFIEVFSKIIFKWYLKSFCNPLCNIQPIQSEKKIKEESQAQPFFKYFSLIRCPNKRTPKVKSESVDDNSYGEESVTEVCEHWEEDMADAKAIPNVWEVDQKHDNIKIVQAEKAVKDDQPIKKGSRSLIHDENDHWYICHKNQSTCDKLSQPQHQQHWVITRAEELMLQCVHHQNLSFVENC